MSLSEKIAELITKEQIKFKTHKKRKAFIAALVEIVKNETLTTVSEETKPVITNRDQQKAVTTIVPGKKSAGAVVLTKGMSEKNDDINKASVAKFQAIQNYSH